MDKRVIVETHSPVCYPTTPDAGSQTLAAYARDSHSGLPGRTRSDASCSPSKARTDAPGHVLPHGSLPHLISALHALPVEPQPHASRAATSLISAMHHHLRDSKSLNSADIVRVCAAIPHFFSPGIRRGCRASNKGGHLHTPGARATIQVDGTLFGDGWLPVMQAAASLLGMLLGRWLAALEGQQRQGCGGTTVRLSPRVCT
jgi:hypothetical protein